MKASDVKRLFQSIESNDLATVARLIKVNNDSLETPGAHNKYVRDKTPLMYALQCSNLGIARYLLSLGANPSARMIGGPRSTVLSLSCRFGAGPSTIARHDDWTKIVGEMIDRGADPNDGLWAACHAYIPARGNIGLVQLLIERGADPDRTVGNSGNTARELVRINAHRYPPEFLKLFE